VKLPAPLLLGVGLGLVAVLGVYFVGRRALEAARDAAPLVTPTSSANLVYGGAIGGVGRVLSQDPHWTLGGWIRDLTSSDEEKIRRMLEGAPPKSGASIYPDF
jgi:hypothetical protein